MDLNELSKRHDFQRIVARFEAKRAVLGPDDCWLWTDKPGGTGYGVLSVQVNGKTQLIAAHRLSFILANGPIGLDDNGYSLCVCHRCDTRLCTNPAHLFLGTDADNKQDMIAKGRNHRPAGELSPSAKLTQAEVEAIRRDRRKPSVIAREYGISAQTAKDVRTLRTWKSVPGERIEMQPHPQKLTAEKVLEIRADPRGCRRLSRVYGVAASTIGQIKRREIWKHV